jgi:recombination associated protein RdgC
MQLEEKILPATVVTQELNNKIKNIKTSKGRKVYKKEKQELKDEITSKLLPKAFSKLSKVYAYIDIEHSLLIVDTTVKSKLDKFISLFKKTFGDNAYHEVETKKIAPILTRWLLNDSYPSSFAIEQSCVMVDPNQQSRVIRCQHQDLSFKAIQQLLQDGYTINQLSLNWQDKITFTLTDGFDLKTIKYTDDVIDLAKDSYNESPEHKFNADFYIMTETLSALVNKLIVLFRKNK